jgi:RNA polymerase sigma-70 factor (sigma-E family)
MTTDVSETRKRSVRLEELYVRNAPAAVRFAYFLTGNREAAEELVQEAFVRVAGRFQHLREPDNVPAYLRRTILNLHASHLRRRRLERAWLRRESSQESVSAEADIATRDDLWRALALLPDRQRAALVLRYYEDLSEAETARVLGCSVGALNQLVVRAKTTLRQHVQGDIG